MSNGGEEILVTAAEGEEILRFAYSDQPPWPAVADGGGRSLELFDAWSVPTVLPAKNAFLALAQNWRASNLFHGSPGRFHNSGISVEALEPRGHRTFDIRLGDVQR